ncbi:precorrin-6y C5,15-methyltransferase (decarboxylating) subunit CbiE [Desertibaculum subflavum]|uniref:precorrin-6y C5,15-methyltransferase (decarboxylating) subunit CbiE n=1 Tax=Desertibaculum subflavum TaxID=2268458 RepID=UPI000E66FD08
MSDVEATATSRWLSIVGIGEDGVEGLSASARGLVAGAELVVGGQRHLDLARPLLRAATETWSSPIEATIALIRERRGRQVCVLASGDPFCFGIGGTLAESIPSAEMTCMPAPSAFALACARLGWPSAEIATISFCGRPIEPLRPLLQPGARILALSADATTPARVAGFLTALGFGPSRVHVLEAMGGPRERMRVATADTFELGDVHPLNLLAIEVIATAEARILPLGTGLADDLFEHDGQITKREIRAITLAQLTPRAGDLLWDIGCGAGSVAVEWLLRNPAGRAIGVDVDAERVARALRNAVALGVPKLVARVGRAPDTFADLPPPDAIFIGGGAHEPALIERAWDRLRSGGRIVANGVTLETEARLIAAHGSYGGELIRIALERGDHIGRRRAFRPAMTVVQWAAVKP